MLEDNAKGTAAYRNSIDQGAEPIASRSVVERFMVLAFGRYQTAVVALLSVLLSLVAIVVIGMAAGVTPWTMLSSIFEGSLQGRYAILSTFAEFSAISLTGLAVLLPLRSGFFNIGGQGQVEFGALAAVVVGLYLKAPPAIVIVLGMVASCLAGALAGLVPLLLKVKRGASEVTTTIMMNFACVMFMYAMVTGPLKDPKSFYGTTRLIPEAMRLPKFPGTEINVAVLLAALTALLMFVLVKYTVFGLQSAALGYNTNAARAGGIPVVRTLAVSVLLGAALAGLAGGIQQFGFSFRVAEGWSKTWGFTGIPVAFLGSNPLGVILVAMVFAILEVGSRHMQALNGVPAALISLFQGLPVLIFIGLKAVVRLSRWSRAR
jgi:general nucleoside transport system permease protein